MCVCAHVRVCACVCVCTCLFLCLWKYVHRMFFQIFSLQQYCWYKLKIIENSWEPWNSYTPTLQNLTNWNVRNKQQILANQIICTGFTHLYPIKPDKGGIVFGLSGATSPPNSLRSQQELQPGLAAGFRNEDLTNHNWCISLGYNQEYDTCTVWS